MLFETEVLKPGEKVLKVRERLRMTQDDLEAYSGIDRTHISRIEKGNGFKRVTADKLTDGFNKYINDHNLSIEKITSDWIMEKHEEQIERLTQRCIEQIHKVKMTQDPLQTLEILINKINQIISDHNIAKKFLILIYNALTNAYIDLAYYSKSKEYSLKQINIAIQLMDNKLIINAYVSLIRSYFFSSNYEETLQYSEYIVDFANEQNLQAYDSMKIVYFNGAIAAKKLDNYDLCLEYIKKLSIFDLPIEKCLEIDLEKGICYLNKGMYSDAEIIFKNIIPLAIQNEKVNILSLTYLNLAETKMEQNLELEAATFIEETLKLKTTGRYTPLIAAHSILLYLRLNNLDYVELNFINTLDIIIKWNDKELFMLVIEKIFEKYVEEVLDAKIVALLDVTRKMILEKNISDLRLGYIFFIAADYFRNIDIKRSEEYFRFGLKVKNI